jgi:hypothetical protein
MSDDPTVIDDGNETEVGAIEPNSAHNIRAEFLDLVAAYDSADAAVAEAQRERRKIKLRVKEAGFNIRAFDRARRESSRDYEEREGFDQEYRRFMVWLGMPLGTQGDMFESPGEYVPVKRRRGRPVGSRNRPREHSLELEQP